MNLAKLELVMTVIESAIFGMPLIRSTVAITICRSEIIIIIIIIIISFIKRKNYRIKLFLYALQLRKILLHKRLMFD